MYSYRKKSNCFDCGVYSALEFSVSAIITLLCSFSGGKLRHPRWLLKLHSWAVLCDTKQENC